MILSRLLAATALMAVAAPALAQADDIIVTAQRRNATEVTSGGDLGALGRMADAPFSVRSYNEALILNQQPQTIGQVLENDPTVRTSYGFGNAAEQFEIRGFQLYGDDVRLNGLFGITPRQLVAPELFESVQVLNGASAFLFGAAPGGSGIGGGVNLQLKRAGADPLTRATLGYTSGSHFGGSFDVSRRFGGNDAFGVRVNGAFRSGDVSVDGEFRRSAVLGGALDWQGESTRLSLDLGYQKVEVRGLRHKATIGATAIPAPPAASANFAQPWTYTDLRDLFGILRLEQDLADNALFYLTAGARDGSEDGIYGGLTVLDATTGDANGNALYVPRTDNNEALEAGLRVNLKGAVSHRFNIGVSAAWQVNRNAFDFLYGPGFAGFPTNLYDAPEVEIPSSSFVGGDLDNPFPISRTRVTSVFASDTVGLWEDRLLLTGGLRLQSMRIRAYNYYNGGQLDTTYEADAVTPAVGVTVKPVEGVSLYANWIEGLQQGPTAPLDPNLTNPGQVFGPVRSTQYELGGKVALGGVDAGLALFQISLPTAYAVPADAANPSGPLTYGLNGQQRNRGFELTLAAEPTQGLRLIGGLAHVDAVLRRTANGLYDGNSAVGVPKWTANANAEWDLPFAAGLTLTGRLVYTGSQQVNAANTLEIGDWARVDLGARYVLAAAGKPVTLRMTVDNVANARYWASAFDVFSAALLQGTPRTVKASASIDF